MYTSQNINDDEIETYLEQTCIPKLTLNQKTECDKDISHSELRDVIFNFKKGKSPGTDGLTPELYQCFYEDIKFHLMSMLQECFIDGELCESMKQGIITLIHKGGDELEMKNYRPVSLTNYDYKILAFIMANRIQNVINSLINPDQVGYIKGRFIGNNARNLIDIMEYAEKFEKEGAVLCLDFMKAFDSLEWNFMFQTLRKYNFGNSILKWITVLYTNPISMIKNNGWIGRKINIYRGVRQGCPVSSLLFILCTEIMNIRLRSSENVKGFVISDVIKKLFAYADDTSLALRDKESIAYSLNIIGSFGNVSGLKLNKTKCVGMWLGPYKDTSNMHENIVFTNEPVKCLGIYIGHNKEKQYELNWNPKIEKMKVILNMWKMRKLTLAGKVLILSRHLHYPNFSITSTY